MSGSSSNVLREYLVRIAYAVDGSSQSRFLRGLRDVAVQAKLTADAIEAASRQVAQFVSEMSRQAEALYFASQRTKASVEGIKALQFALTQAGGSAEGALGAVEGIARFIRNTPAGEGFIRGLGVQTRTANGALRDTSEIVTDLGARLAKMPNWLANSYGGVLGLDERTLLAMRQGLGDAAATYHRFVQAAGLDQQKAAATAHAFIVSSRTATTAITILYEKAASGLAGPLAAGIDKFTAWLVGHYDQIISLITRGGRAVLWIGSVISSAVGSIAEAASAVLRWFDGLDAGTQRLIEAAGALLIAWRLLSRGFLATPLGALVAALTGLFLLIEDYAGWKSGKRSLIDWSAWDKPIQSMIAAFEKIGGWVSGLVEGTVGWQTALEALAVYIAGSWLTRVLASFGRAAAGQAAATAAAGASGASGAAVKGGLLRGLLRSWLPAWLLEQGANAVDDRVPGLKRLDDAVFGTVARGAKSLLGIGSAQAAEVTPPGGQARNQQFDATISGTLEQRQAQLVGWLQSNLGLTTAQAAGIAGNATQESTVGAAMQEGRPLSGRGGLGLFQWTGSRRREFEAWAAAHNMYSSTMSASLGFFREDIMKRQYAGVLAGVRRAGSAVEAARAFFPFESGGDPRTIYGRRDLYAQDAERAYGRFGGGGTQMAGAAVNQHNTTHVHVDGARDPVSTARAVGAEQTRVAQASVRQLRSVVS